MNLFKISLAYIYRRKLNTLLNMLLLGLGTGIVVVLLLFGEQFEENLHRNVQNIDVVVGAKGSPLQLILSSVFHVDVPTGNIPLLEARKLAKNRAVAQAIPLALGDNYRGYRIVGTTSEYAKHYRAELVDGTFWDAPYQVVIGAQVVRETGLALGDEVISSHGLTAETASEQHESQPFRVVGVLRPTGSIIDRLLLTAVETVWLVHEPHEEEGDGQDHHMESHADEDRARDVLGLPMDSEADAEREVTGLLIRYRSPIAAVSFPRYVNKETKFQAASPAFETTRLFALLGVGLEVVRVFGGVLVFAAALSIFVALYNAMKDRRYDLAMMRALGASRGKLFVQALLEGVLLTLMGTGLGFVLGHASTEVIGAWVREAQHINLTGWIILSDEFWLIGLALVLGSVSALIPALQVYRTDVAQTLVEVSG